MHSTSILPGLQSSARQLLSEAALEVGGNPNEFSIDQYFVEDQGQDPGWQDVDDAENEMNGLDGETVDETEANEGSAVHQAQVDVLQR